MALGYVFSLVLLLCHGVIAGPPGPETKQTLSERAATPRKLHGKFLHITDFHPDEYYKVHSSTEEDDACHRGKGPAGPYGAETTDCDSPFSLVNATFDWIAANLRDSIDFVIWTGDSARHDRDEGLPRNADQVLGTNTRLADKFAQLFADKDGRGMTIPVIPTFGNNDILPHNILLPGPNQWLQHYSHIWRHFIPEEQRHSFEFGGWFHVEVVPNKLAVFSLNTLYFFDRNAGVDGCADPKEPGYKQMEWLRVQLQFLRERGMKAILMGHVPPARTESKRLWDETCWQRYSLWMHQFRDVVVASLYGHMNIDHFLIHDTHDIDIAALSGVSGVGIREAMEDELSVRSASDYLQELRNDWAKLTPPPSSVGKPEEVIKVGKRKKGKKRQDPWGERYHLSLVSPSIVPNYFPTLRVLEYNISGLEVAPVWKDAPRKGGEDYRQKHLELRHDPDITLTKKKNNNKNKDKTPKKKPKTDDPNLKIPSPPSKSTPPGPAYSPQPFTLIGYTQYYANLTHINNLNLTDPSQSAEEGGGSFLARLLPLRDWLLRWRSGKHGGRKPAPTPQPRDFAFEVEYSTFEDRIYQLGDLTVNSLVELAVRIGGTSSETRGGAGEMVGGWEHEEEREEVCDDDAGLEDDDEEESGGCEGEEDESEVELEKKKGKKGNGKQNKTWLHFLSHAFVGTLEKEKLKKFQ